VAFGVVRHPQVAEDVCQDAIVKLIASPGQVHKPEQVRAWLVTTITNGAFEHRRRKKAESAAIQSRDWPNGAMGSAGSSDFLLHEKLLKCVAELEPGIREVVVLRTMQGLSGKEVQDVLGLSLSEVSRRLQGGLERLRRAMNDGQE